MENVILCLKWYIENDETNIGQAGNGFWEAGKLKAIRTLIAIDPELEWKYFDDLQELITSDNYGGG